LFARFRPHGATRGWALSVEAEARDILASQLGALIGSGRRFSARL